MTLKMPKNLSIKSFLKLTSSFYEGDFKKKISDLISYFKLDLKKKIKYLNNQELSYLKMIEQTFFSPELIILINPFKYDSDDLILEYVKKLSKTQTILILTADQDNFSKINFLKYLYIDNEIVELKKNNDERYIIEFKSDSNLKALKNFNIEKINETYKFIYQGDINELISHIRKINLYDLKIVKE
jgi:hypothetical protein